MGSSGDKQKLSLFDATMLFMGGIVGVGIFFNPHRIARLVPDATAYLSLWAVAGLIAMCAAFTFAELGGSFPKAGGWFVYLREAFGPFAAFLFAWVVLFVISTGAIASISKFGAEQLGELFPGVLGAPGSPAQFAVAALAIVLVTAAALSGVKRAAMLQNLCMLTKLGVIAALIVGGFALAGGGAAASPAPAAEPAALGDGMLRALLPIFYTYGGWQLLGYIAPEIRDPQRNLPRAILMGSTAVLLVYLLVNASFLHVLGIHGIAQDEHFAATVAERTLGGAGKTILLAGMAVSALGICAVNIITAPWLYVAMARERLFFESFGRLSPRTGVPTRALVVQCGVALVYLFASLGFLVDWIVFVEWIFHFLAALALLVLRRKRADLPRPFKSPLFPLAPAVYLATAAVVVGSTLYQAEPKLKFTGLAILLAGALVYGPWRNLMRRGAAG